MTDNNECPFDDDLSSDEDEGSSLFAQQRHALKEQRWEETCVKRMCAFTGESARITPAFLAMQFKERTGEARVTFAGFEQHTGFPVQLHFKKLHYKVLEAFKTNIFKKPEKSKLVKVFFECYDQYPDEKQQGVVFEWLHEGSRFKIIHNLGATSAYGPRIEFETPSHWLVVQDFDVFLKELDWNK